jgi:hypothetical protein
MRIREIEKTVGQRIASDIFSVPNIGNASYLVNFAYDYSWYTWVYTMTNHNDLFPSFGNFASRKEMDTLCHSPSEDDIEMLYMDNPQKYVSLRYHLRHKGLNEF